MKRSMTRRVLFGFCFVLFAAYLWECGDARCRRSRASRLLSDVQKLRVGTTSGDEIKRLSENYCGTFHKTWWPDPGYLIVVESRHVNIREQPYPIPGQRLWSVAAYLCVRDNRLKSVVLVTGIYRSDRREMGATVLIDTSHKTIPKGLSYYVHYGHGSGPPMELLGVDLTPDASPDQARRAFNVNLSCLTSLFECRNVCEVLPSAWNDLPLEKRMLSRDAYGKEIGAECQAAIGRK
jgi:hypothetical protein